MTVKALPRGIIFFGDNIVIRGWRFPIEERCRTTNVAEENVGNYVKRRGYRVHIQIIFGIVVKALPGCIIFFRDDIVIRGRRFPFEERCRTTNAAEENVGKYVN